MGRVLVVSHRLTRDRLTGRKFWEMTKEKLKNSRTALGVTKGLIGNDCKRVYNCFWGLAHDVCVGYC